jgi:hypothetical protein
VISINLFLFPVPVSKRIVTPCNSNKQIGKVKPIKTLQKSTQFQSALAQIGDSWQISEDLFLQMEAFTCLLYDGKEVSYTLPTIVMSRLRIYWFCNMGSFPNSYLIVNSFQMFSQTVYAWRQYT